MFIRGLVLAVFTLFVYFVRNRKKLNKGLVLVCLWSGYSLFGALLSGRPYPHYLLQPAVPVSLLVIYVFLIDNVVGWLMFGFVAVSSVVSIKQIGFWMYPTVSYYRNFVEMVSGRKNTRDYVDYFSSAKMNFPLAEYLNARMQDDDGLYVWGTDSSLYNLTDTLPAGGKYIVSFHVRDFRAFDEVMENLEKNSPEYVVVLPDPIEFPALFELLELNYMNVFENQGAVVYRKFPSILSVVRKNGKY